MAILNQKKILNLIPKVSAPVTIHVSQGDVGTVIEFTLVRGDEVFVNPGNTSASVHGVREDGANFGPFTCTLSGSKVTFPLHSEMTAVKGSAIAEIVLVDNGGNKVGSANFGILVEESVFPLGVTYDNDVSVYESILAYAQSSAAVITSTLNNEISERISADALINTRIDEIIAPSGEAPSVAEVTDARIGADGKTYSSLGASIRAQINELVNGFNENVLINIPAGATSDRLVTLWIPYDTGYEYYYENLGGYEEGVSLTHYFDEGTENPVVLNEYQINKAPNTHYLRVKLNYSRMKKEDGVVVGGEIRLRIKKSLSNNFASCIVYAGGGSEITWSNTSPITLNFGTSNLYVVADNDRYTINNEDIVAAAQNSSYVTYGDHSITGNKYALLYDINGNRVLIVSGDNYSAISRYVVLFTVYYNSYIYGALVNYMEPKNYARINSIANKADTLLSSSFSSDFSYVDFEIPAGATANIDFPFKMADNENFAGMFFYFEASDEVYGSDPEDNTARIYAQNYSTSQIVYKGAENISKKLSEPPLVFRAYYSRMTKDENDRVVGGTIRLYYKTAVSLEQPIINGKEFIKYLDRPVPVYYSEHIAGKAATIRENMMNVGRNGETFIFITDTHWEINRKNSPSLVKYLFDNLNINLILHGGDLINQGEREPMSKLMVESVRAFTQNYNIFMPIAFGNHDSNWNDYDGQREHPERYFDEKAQYALMQKQAEGHVTYITTDKWNFYFDVVATKTRFIIIDTGEDGSFNKYSELISCMNSTPSGYHIIMMGHILRKSGAWTTACNNIMILIDAYNTRQSGTVASVNYDFTLAQATVNLLLSGHTHYDVDTVTTSGVPVVTTDCDAGVRTNNPDYPYVAETITEQAFDVFTVDYSTGDVKAVRIGRGEDRNWVHN